MAENRVKVAIVGGGIAGLALAVGLIKKPHLDVHVYESVPAYKDVGAGLALHLNAIKAMTLIGAEVRQAYFDKALTMGDENQEMVTEVILGQGPHQGQLVAELGRAKGRKTVSRADLLDGYLALIPSENISFGRKLVKITEKSSDRHVVHMSFQDGTEAAADCLLGADGIHSVTRNYLLGADHPAASPKNHDGWQIYRTLISTEEARKQINPKWTTSVPILLGPRGHINCIPLNKNTRLSAGVAVRGAISPTSQEGKPLDPALYADYSEEAQQIVRMVARDTSASWAAGDHDHAPYYTRDRVAMFGDAAHAALPFAGNGAAQALEDAAVLDALFAEVKHPDQITRALAAFDRVRRPRSQAVVELARKFGRVYAYAEDGMHEDPERMRAFFAEMAAFTNEFDVRGQNETALRVFKEIDGVHGDLRN
ncbi:FAD/NAD(P)-binding domain-containing protein [Annulohypoxylon maeteangense]|uniref:FAD/NAD(P)-binding domain-containing protein n=1 Tax=Annulohypoxylon maeteangense TaxID=1927788 RepID=UPI002008C5F0|nr:FAD/NAD(P)-binding domain-containing protein [Annulohypoxylon maeteangense]KAI0884394.1 FAD/NAD(P)-binding domain-containing protein [Annulohypoxylon maeteangense]